MINQYYTQLSTGFVNGISRLFVDSDYSIANVNGAVLVPGDPSVLAYAGLYLSAYQIEQYHALFVQTVQESTPLSDPLASNVTNGGSVAVFWSVQGTSQLNSNTYTMTACDYFQITTSGGQPKIMRLTRFFDTWNVTVAVTNGNPFLQFRNEVATSVAIMFPLVKAIIALCCANFAVMVLVVYCVRRGANNDGPAPNRTPRGATPLLS